MLKTQRLLVSVRGPIEALEAAQGGAYISDAEFRIANREGLVSDLEKQSIDKLRVRVRINPI